MLLRLAELSNEKSLANKARLTLECFAGVVEHFGLYAASFALALRRMLRPSIQVVVVGEGALGDELEHAALRGFAVEKIVVRLRWIGQLPPSLAETIPHLPKQEGCFAVVCRGFACGLPLHTAEEITKALAG